MSIYTVLVWLFRSFVKPVMKRRHAWVHKSGKFCHISLAPHFPPCPPSLFPSPTSALCSLTFHPSPLPLPFHFSFIPLTLHPHFSCLPSDFAPSLFTLPFHPCPLTLPSLHPQPTHFALSLYTPPLSLFAILLFTPSHFAPSLFTLPTNFALSLFAPPPLHFKFTPRFHFAPSVFTPLTLPSHFSPLPPLHFKFCPSHSLCTFSFHPSPLTLPSHISPLPSHLALSLFTLPLSPCTLIFHPSPFTLSLTFHTPSYLYEFGCKLIDYTGEVVVLARIDCNFYIKHITAQLIQVPLFLR